MPSSASLSVFVTVGTTQFDALIRTVLSEESLCLLLSLGYTEIQLQYGSGQQGVFTNLPYLRKRKQPLLASNTTRKTATANANANENENAGVTANATTKTKTRGKTKTKGNAESPAPTPLSSSVVRTDIKTDTETGTGKEEDRSPNEEEYVYLYTPKAKLSLNSSKNTSENESENHDQNNNSVKMETPKGKGERKRNDDHDGKEVFEGKEVDLDSIQKIQIRLYRYKNNIIKDMESADLIISHAGAGSIMEGLGLQKKMIVVINDSLMDNHQTEVADALEKENYLYSTTPNKLCSLLLEKDLSQLKIRPPPDTTLFPALLLEEMGF